MLLTRSFPHRRMTLLGLAGALALCSFLIAPQGQAFAAMLGQLLRGQMLAPVPTDYSHLQNAYTALEDLATLGTLQGTIPTQPTAVSSIAAAASQAGFTPAQPGAWPAGISHTAATIKAMAPTTVTLTLSKSKVDAYFQAHGSATTMPASYDGEQLIVNFPGVTLLEYTGTQGGRLFVGQASQVLVQTNGNASASQIRDFLLQLPSLKPDTAATLKKMSNWSTTIPLGIPTDRAGWSSYTVGGSLGGAGVLLNDNTGAGSAVIWQRSNGSTSHGIGGVGLTANDVKTVAGSLQ